MARYVVYSLVALAATIAVFTWLVWQIASLQGSDGLPGGRGYISDEVWYIPAARNILHDFFKTAPSSNYYTTYRECLTNSSVVVKEYYNVDAVTAEGAVTCHLRRGFPYPDKSGILTYYNLEHPPLAKYIMAFVLWLRDEPMFWRLPSIVLGAATIVLVYLAARRIAGEIWALVAAALMLFDNTFRAMSGVAMLDIYLAFFTALATYYYLTGRTLAVGAAVGMAASVKYSGAFLIFGLAYLYGKSNLWKFAAVFLMATSIFLLVNIPVAGHLGLGRWVQEVVSALAWHTTSRPPGPVASSPLDWLIMQNSFVIYLNPDVYASGTPAYIVALIYALIRRDDVSILYLSAYGGYWLVYLAGNHTLYSFYTAHFSPLAHVTLARLLSDIARKF